MFSTHLVVLVVVDAAAAVADAIGGLRLIGDTPRRCDGQLTTFALRLEKTFFFQNNFFFFEIMKNPFFLSFGLQMSNWWRTTSDIFLLDNWVLSSRCLVSQCPSRDLALLLLLLRLLLLLLLYFQVETSFSCSFVVLTLSQKAFLIDLCLSRRNNGKMRTTPEKRRKLSGKKEKQKKYVY